MGMAEMMMNNNLHHLNFLTGETECGKYIHIDLERDQVFPTEFTVTSDIDSIIWVTRRPKFNTAVNVTTAPVIRGSAPIQKSNHVYVQLLVPQTEADQARTGERTEWVTLCFPLSQIPHIFFGSMGGHSNTINIYLFFPRIVHQNPITKWWAVNVPKHIQDIFWSKVVLPAMSIISDLVDQPYLGDSQEHVRFKRNKSPASPTMPFRTANFERLLQQMAEIVENDNQNLSQFGSHFYVAEVKGCKHYTKIIMAGSGNMDIGTSLEESRQHLIQEFPAFSWEDMVDQNRGEIYCDVGITITPANSADPLVGLWKLDWLEASFGASGYIAGNLHRINTMDLYGSLQAEMRQKHAERSHVVFRSAYNLAYEVIRNKNNTRVLFTDKDAYSLEPQYIEHIDNVLSIYRDVGPKNSYGVRDEYRIGGRALMMVMGDIHNKVEKMINAQPMIWISSKLWFGFLSRRIQALFHVQRHLVTTHADNLGVMTGLISFLTQSTISTPKIVQPYTNEALAMLRYKNVVSIFGMMFLHGLDLTKDPCLEEVHTTDPLVVLDLMGVIPPAKRAHLALGGHEALDRFPLGAWPTWKQIKICIATVPRKLIESPRIPEEWINDSDSPILTLAINIFKQFTHHIWICLHDTWVYPDAMQIPGTLQEALECWTLDSVYVRLRNVKFLASNADLDGTVSGIRLKSFEARREMYFPKNMRKTKGIWEALRGEESYITHYARKYADLGDDHDSKQRLDQLLGNFLSYCECLPNSSRSLDPGIKEGGQQGKVWDIDGDAVIMVTNAAMYKVAGIGRGGRANNNTTRRPPTHLTGKQFGERVLVAHGFPPKIAQKAINISRKKKQSKKLNNRRVPPKKHPRSNDESTNPGGGLSEHGKEDDSDDMDSNSD
ncbi:hypothetical protein BD779DRAFT_1681314 [Infundibulicybe gibba]|nr:hypothetical protein BD779DRAFT_1681314 [Infundibulicybe gibba]